MRKGSSSKLSLSEVDALIAESEARWLRLQARYDPVTGKGISDIIDQERVVLKIKDYAVPVQYVPAAVAETPLIKEIVRYGSIDKFLKKHPWQGDDGAPDRITIERRIRKVRHKHDFPYWAYSCIRIRYKLGGRGPFILNYAQFQVYRLCEELRLNGVPINIVIDKARQWGGSTFCIFYQFWLLTQWDNYHSFSVAAHQNDASRRILNMLVEAIRDYPAWDLGLGDEETLHLAPYLGSSHDFVVKDSKDEPVMPGIITVGSAEKPDSLRSANLSGAHYSEVAVWPDTPGKKSEDLVADISGGIVQRPLTMQVYESTAKTSADFFHDVCMAALKKQSNFRCIFIPFFFIPHDTLKVIDKKAFAKWLLDHRYDDFACDGHRSPGKYYWWLWEQGACFESINWYMYTELTFTKRSQMVNEAPASLEESFMSAGKLVFDFFDVDRMMKGCRPPVWEGELISDDRTGPGVIENIRFIDQAGGRLKVWEKPDDSPISDRYAVAVDIGGANPTSDWSSIRVIDRLMMMPSFGLGGIPSVVAEIHYHADHDAVAYDAARLAAWYNNALLIIESNTLETKDKERDTGGDGFEYILDIVSGFYRPLYARHKKEEDFENGIQRKWGFHTNVSTKPKIIDNMRACLRDGLWDEPCKYCCEEMAAYVDIDGKFTAPPKMHDDELMATAILLWVAYKEMPLPAWKKERDYGHDSDDIQGNNSSIVRL